MSTLEQRRALADFAGKVVLPGLLAKMQKRKTFILIGVFVVAIAYAWYTGELTSFEAFLMMNAGAAAATAKLGANRKEALLEQLRGTQVGGALPPAFSEWLGTPEGAGIIRGEPFTVADGSVRTIGDLLLPGVLEALGKDSRGLGSDAAAPDPDGGSADPDRDRAAGESRP